MKVALFDIDKTIIKCDSMFLFVWFGLKKKPRTFLNLFNVFVFTLLYGLKLINAEKVKEYYFYAIKFLKEEDLYEFYNILQRDIYRDALIELKKKKEQGYHIILITASPTAYMKYFEQYSFVDKVIGTELIKNTVYYTNKVRGKNCKGIEKVKKIKEYLKQNNLIIDYAVSSAYSDSLSDIPMFELVQNRYLVNQKKEGFRTLNWS